MLQKEKEGKENNKQKVTEKKGDLHKKPELES
jgi:hypothetical protein